MVARGDAARAPGASFLVIDRAGSQANQRFGIALRPASGRQQLLSIPVLWLPAWRIDRVGPALHHPLRLFPRARKEPLCLATATASSCSRRTSRLRARGAPSLYERACPRHRAQVIVVRVQRGEDRIRCHAGARLRRLWSRAERWLCAATPFATTGF